MLDYLLTGLSAGILVFLTLFFISFITLGVITGFVHLSSVIYRGLFVVKVPSYRSRALKKPDWNFENEPEWPSFTMGRIQAANQTGARGYHAPPRAKERRLSTLMGLNRSTHCDPAK